MSSSQSCQHISAELAVASTSDFKQIGTGLFFTTSKGVDWHLSGCASAVVNRQKKDVQRLAFRSAEVIRPSAIVLVVWQFRYRGHVHNVPPLRALLLTISTMDLWQRTAGTADVGPWELVFQSPTKKCLLMKQLPCQESLSVSWISYCTEYSTRLSSASHLDGSHVSTCGTLLSCWRLHPNWLDRSHDQMVVLGIQRVWECSNFLRSVCRVSL